MSNGRPADVLQEVDLKIISDETCEKTKNSGYLVKEWFRTILKIMIIENL